MQFLLIYGMLFFHLIIYGIYGALIDKVMKLGSNQSLYPIIGYIFMSLCFQGIAIPLQLLKVSLSVTAYVYVFILIITFFCLRRMVKLHLSYKRGKEIYKDFLLLAIIILIQWIVLMCNMCYGSVWDTSKYIGQISTALYTDTMQQYEPYSGKIYSFFDWKNCFIVYEMHSAVLCKLFQIHPLIYVHRILASLEIAFVYIIYYNIALCLFNKSKVKTNMTILFVMVINFFAYSLYSWSGFLFIRTAESKSMLANVILPLMLLWVIKIVNERKNNIFFLLLGTIIMGLGISKSGAFIIPTALILEIIPILWINKRPKMVLKYSICFVPCILNMLIYLM